MPTHDAAFEALTLAEIEESAGELHRRVAAALRAVGEERADAPGPEGVSPRREAASLAASLELAALALADASAGGEAALPPDGRPPAERVPALAAAIAYAAPSIGALLARLEQDRRLAAALARTLEPRLGAERALRRLLVEALLGAPARCAMALETHAAREASRGG